MTKSEQSRNAGHRPRSVEELDRLSPQALSRLKLTEEETRQLYALNQARERERKERAARIQEEQALLLAELRSIGLPIHSVSDISHDSARYQDAVPILLRHLLLPYSSATRETIARVLATPAPAVRKAWPVLVDQYKTARSGFGLTAPGDTRESEYLEKDALAYVLATAVTDRTLDELVGLVKDPQHGPSRVLLLPALKRRRKNNPSVRQLVDELASDPDLQREIASWRPA